MHTVSLKVWTISPGFYGDLFRIRGFSPITGLISLFSRPLSSSPLCFPVNLFKSASLSSAFFCPLCLFFLFFPTLPCSELLCNILHIYDFKSSYFLYAHTPRHLCNRCNVTHRRNAWAQEHRNNIRAYSYSCLSWLQSVSCHGRATSWWAKLLQHARLLFDPEYHGI